jgi:hypothetical protein
MQKFFSLFVCFYFLLQAKAQFRINELPASAAVCSRHFASPSAALINPAALANLPGAGLVLFARRPYGIAALSELQLHAAFPLSVSSGLYAGCRRFGTDYFSEISLATGYGLLLSKQLQIGVNFQYTTAKPKGFNKTCALIAGLSTGFTTSKFKSALIFKYGLNSFAFAPGRYTMAGMGIGKDWSPQLYTDFLIYFDSAIGWAEVIAVQYELVHAWLVVLRVETHPFRYTVETGYQLNRLSLRVSSEWHPQLGFSPGIVLAYTLSSKNSADDQTSDY